MGASKKFEPNPAESAAERMAEVREEIDAVDKDILERLNRRAELSLEVGKLKAGNRDLIFKPFREREVIDKLIRENRGPLPSEHLRAVYREIFSSSRSLQRPQKVGYLGPEGTFSYFAGLEFLGGSVDYRPMADIEEVFQAAASREVELGVIPLENSLQGTVGQSLDCFLRYDVYIEAEIFCRISHSIFGRVEQLSQVKVVYSHPQPLAQCGGWLRANLPRAGIVPTESTAAAGRRVLEEPGSAAIGHKALAQMLGLNVLASGVEDQPDNWTRFVIIGSYKADDPGDKTIRDKTSILFTLPDKPGALASILNVLATNEINMKKLESRPMRGEKWKYVFFVDLECDLGQKQYEAVLKQLSENCNTLRILGGYPSGPYLDFSGRGLSALR